MVFFCAFIVYSTLYANRNEQPSENLCGLNRSTGAPSLSGSDATLPNCPKAGGAFLYGCFPAFNARQRNWLQKLSGGCVL